MQKNLLNQFNGLHITNIDFVFEYKKIIVSCKSSTENRKIDAVFDDVSVYYIRENQTDKPGMSNEKTIIIESINIIDNNEINISSNQLSGLESYNGYPNISLITNRYKLYIEASNLTIENNLITLKKVLADIK